MISDTARLRPSLLALSGGIVASTVAALYVVLITREDSVPRERVQIAFIASMLIATGATGRARPGSRAPSGRERTSARCC